MAIDTYSKLLAEILDTLQRCDLVADVEEYTPGSIEGALMRAVAKAQRRLVRRLRTREFETSVAVKTTNGVETIPLPVDFVMMKMLVLNQSPTMVLAQKDLVTLYGDYPAAATGAPRAYAAFGPTLYLRPIPDGDRSLKMFYYAAPTLLSHENTSNVLLTKYPDLLLYASLIEVTAHLEDDGRIGLWKAAFDEAVRDVLNDDLLNRWSGAPLRAGIDQRGIN